MTTEFNEFPKGKIRLSSYHARYDLASDKAIEYSNNLSKQKITWIDVGCGDEISIEQNLRQTFYRFKNERRNIWYIGVDLYNEPKLPEDFRKKGLEVYFDFVIADARMLPFRDRVADIVTEYGASKTAREGKEIREEIARIIKRSLFIYTECSSTIPLEEDLSLTLIFLKVLENGI